jgi:hypothetical protein
MKCREVGTLAISPALKPSVELTATRLVRASTRWTKRHRLTTHIA